MGFVFPGAETKGQGFQLGLVVMVLVEKREFQRRERDKEEREREREREWSGEAKKQDMVVGWSKLILKWRVNLFFCMFYQVKLTS